MAGLNLNLDLNLINYGNNNEVTEFLDTLYASCFLPLITKPTRIACNSSTLIDNIFCNDLKVNTLSGIIVADVSDHLPIYAVLLSSKLKSFKPNDNHSHYYKRDTSQQALDNLTEDLRNIDWGFIYHCNDVNNVYNDFIHVLSTSFNKHCKLLSVNKLTLSQYSLWYYCS